MDHYVGLDVGLEETSICIVDRSGNQGDDGASGDPLRS